MSDKPEDLEGRSSETSLLEFETFSGGRIAFAKRVLSLALAERIDVALIGHVNYVALGLMLRLLQPRLRYGVVVHGIEVWRPLPFIKRLGLRKADFVMSVSEYSKEKVISLHGVNSSRVRVLPNALEWKEENPNPASMPPPSGAFRLLSVCRLDARERYKGVDTVIEAIPELLPTVPSIHYFVIGSGTDMDRHRELAKALGVSDRVSFLGSVDESTLRAQYQACDLFVMPSAGEGFGIVFLEAMKYSKAIIAADSGAVSEVVKDGVTGTLVQYGNAGQLAGAIAELAANPKQRAAMGKEGYDRLANNFSYEHFKRRFDEILTEEMPSDLLYRSRRDLLTLA